MAVCVVDNENVNLINAAYLERNYKYFES